MEVWRLWERHKALRVWGGKYLIKDQLLCYFERFRICTWEPWWVPALTVSGWLLLGKFCTCPESVLSC